MVGDNHFWFSINLWFSMNLLTEEGHAFVVRCVMLPRRQAQWQSQLCG